MYTIYKPGELTEMAKALYREERNISRLDGWFLAKETEMNFEKKYTEYPAEIKKAYLLCEVIKNIPLSLSENAIFAGTQRDAFAKSYALINPTFTVKGFSGYCDPMAVYNDITPDENFTKERIAKVRAHTAETKMVGITGQMHGIVYTNKNGNAVSPLYTWQDLRGNLPYKDTTYAKYLKSYAGYGNVTDFYNRTNNIRPADAASYCTIHDYLAMDLCKLKFPVIHSSDAASLGCYDILNNRFDYEYSADVLKDLKFIGSYKNIPVCVPVGDNQANVYSTLSNEQNILINIGTGSQVSVVSDKYASGNNIEVRPYFNEKYLIVGAALCGGRAYACLKNFFEQIIAAAGGKCENTYELMANMADDKMQTTLVADTRFSATRSNPSIRGGFFELTENNFTPQDFICSVLYGIANELFGMYKEMDVKRHGIIGSGNAIRKNPTLKKAVEKVFKSPLKIPQHLEEAAFGAALLAMTASGYSNKDVQSLIKYDS